MRTAQFGRRTTAVSHSHVGLHFAMARKVASMSFRPRRDVGSMRGARSSTRESMKWAVQVRRAAITVWNHVHFNSGVLGACYLHGVGGFVFNSPSPRHQHTPVRPPPAASRWPAVFSPGAGGRLPLRNGVGGFAIELIYSCTPAHALHRNHTSFGVSQGTASHTRHNAASRSCFWLALHGACPSGLARPEPQCALIGNQMTRKSHWQSDD